MHHRPLSFLLPYSSSATGSQRQLCPQVTGQLPTWCPGKNEGSEDLTAPACWELKRRPPLPADVPSGKGHLDPGLTTNWAETNHLKGQSVQPHGHMSPDLGCGERSSSHRPTSHIPSASLGNNHAPHTEETQSTDSGFLDTPGASKNSQAMTKQIGIWTANNSSTSLLGSARASPCWALPPLPSPVSETVSCC